MTGLALLHSERPKLYAILAFLGANGLKDRSIEQWQASSTLEPLFQMA